MNLVGTPKVDVFANVTGNEVNGNTEWDMRVLDPEDCMHLCDAYGTAVDKKTVKATRDDYCPLFCWGDGLNIHGGYKEKMTRLYRLHLDNNTPPSVQIRRIVDFNVEHFVKPLGAQYYTPKAVLRTIKSINPAFELRIIRERTIAGVHMALDNAFMKQQSGLVASSGNVTAYRNYMLEESKLRAAIERLNNGQAPQ